MAEFAKRKKRITSNRFRIYKYEEGRAHWDAVGPWRSTQGCLRQRRYLALATRGSTMAHHHRRETWGQFLGSKIHMATPRER